MTPIRAVAVLFCACFASLLLASPTLAGDRTSAVEKAPATKKQAREHFERGLAHFKQEDWEPALAEFLRSRELYPTRSNTQNAAVAFGKLGRFAEALDLSEALLREFPDVPEKKLVEEEIRTLQTKVGTIEVVGAPADATVVIDGRIRGTTPLSKPIRVSTGSHVVRVVKQGAEPFERRLEVAGGEVAKLEAPLAMLTRSGTLRITERGERRAEVLVDGVVVGKTPYEGSLSVGSHAVSLRGSDDLGTQPVTVPVRQDKTTLLKLALEPLRCRLRIDPTPMGGSVALDGVDLGRGSWEGKLRCGDHHLEVASEGFIAVERKVTLEEGRSEIVAVRLERDPSSPLWAAAHPPHVFVTADVAGIIGPSLGGEIADACEGGCTSKLPLGVWAQLRGGYQLSAGLGFSLDVGYLFVRTRYEQRPVTYFTVPTPSPLSGSLAEERLMIQGLSLGASASLQRGRRWPWMVRLSAGLILGTAEDGRRPELNQPTGRLELPVVQESFPARYVFVAPEMRIGPRLSSSWELSFGFRPIVLFALAQPEWTSDSEGQISAGALGTLEFEQESLTRKTLVLFSSSVALRYSFL